MYGFLGSDVSGAACLYQTHHPQQQRATELHQRHLPWRQACVREPAGNTNFM